jgi:DNA-binding response OmpR family regulator
MGTTGEGAPPREVLRILLVEQSGSDARHLRELLDRGLGWRYLLEHATTVEAGLKLIPTFDPSCVLLQAPRSPQDEQSLALIQRVAPTAPLIILTERDDDQESLHFIRLGVEDVLPKAGLDAYTLRRAIAFAIQRKHSSQKGMAETTRQPGLPSVQDLGYTAQEFLDRIRRGRRQE